MGLTDRETCPNPPGGKPSACDSKEKRLRFFAFALEGMVAIAVMTGCGGSSGGSAPLAQPPTVPTNLAAGTATQTSVTLTWTASTSSAGVAGYNVFRNGSKVGTSATASYTDTGLTPATAYSYTVSAYDATGDTSAASAALQLTTLALQPPTTPANLTAGTITASSIALSWTASTSAAAVTGYTVFRNGSKVGTSATASYTLPTAT